MTDAPPTPMAALYKMLRRYLQFQRKHTRAQLDDWAEQYLEDVGAFPASLLWAGIERVTDTPWEWPYPPPAAMVKSECRKIVSALRIEARQLYEDAYQAMFHPAEHQRLCRQSLERFAQVHRLTSGLCAYDLALCREMRSWLALPPPELVPLALPDMTARNGKDVTLASALKEIV